MSQQTLKELLKPPFVRLWNRVRNDSHEVSLTYNVTGDSKLDDELGDFIAAALNEKWERDFGKPMRWVYEYDEEDFVHEVRCPKCKTDYDYSATEDQPDWEITKFCQHCGQRLLPPEDCQKPENVH